MPPNKPKPGGGNGNGNGGGAGDAIPIEEPELKEKEPPKAPPVPKPPRLQLESVPLVDIPCVFLNDRSCWPDFKRALTECGLIWNLSDWMTTILYRGVEWNLIKDNGTDLAAYFPVVEKTNAGDGNFSKISTLGAHLVGLLARPTAVADFKPNAQFCCLSTVEFEDDRRLPARQKLWNWIVRSLRGNRPSAGPFHYLVDEIQMYDISYLFKRLVDVLDQITICSLDDELETIIKMDYKPQAQNIFSYLGDLRKAIKRLNSINERLPEAGRIILPDSYVRSRLIRAARQVPIYKPVLDAILIADIDVWSKMTSEELYHKLEAVCANNQSVQTERTYNSTQTAFDSLSANNIQFKEKIQEKETRKQRPCYDFAKGKCKRSPCSFSHAQQAESKQRPAPTRQTSSKCSKCDSTQHSTDDCVYSGMCEKCGKKGHKQSVCRSRPRANLALESGQDGNSIYANMISVKAMSKNIIASAVSTSPPNGMVRETFLADTGATRSLHPNGRSAYSFSRVSLEISTACVGKTMQSEGVGSMKLYTPEGKLFPGFDNVVFAKQCARKLASVGELCDAGMVCVFDKYGLTTFQEQNVKIEGNFFTKDERDKKTELYPISLFRKANEKNNTSENVFASFVSSNQKINKEEKSKKEVIISQLPAIIDDGEQLPVALLTKTYIKEGLSTVDRYHAKCGDVGVKYLKRVFPSLAIPKLFRCEFCIEGKIHKFGHGPCKPGRRSEYLPGVCIHSDHSGPYARSYGGARYSQLFLDRGSGYLWAFRMNKKTGHYGVTPRVFLDAQALSGRPAQIFHSDGEGVFTSPETVAILAKEKIRQEFSAPYDSNTNPFIERARRTLFEGVATALLRSGAPSSFWGEAECHKVFTINNLPTEEDPDSPGKFLSKKNLLIGDKRLFNVERLMAFGTATTCYVPIEKRRGGKGPAQRRSFKGVLLGYVENMPAYRIWNLEDKKIVSVSYNFTICHEGYYPFRDKTDWPPECKEDPDFFSPTLDGVISTIDFDKFKFDSEDTNEIFSIAPGLVMDRPPPLPRVVPVVNSSPPVVVIIPPVAIIPEPAPIPPPHTRLEQFWLNARDGKGEEKVFFAQENFDVFLPRGKDVSFDKPLSISPPATLREAKLSPWWPYYKKAIQAEYDGHLESKTWVSIPLKNVPSGKNILRGKWILDDKRGEDGKILKFKARFVAMGNTQKYLIDYDETFAGVMVAKSFRILLAILNESPENEMEHWDVKMAFTQAPLEDQIFMYEPEGFETEGEKKHVVELKKSLYGLKQSARNWQLLLNSYCHQNGFSATHADPCVFILKKENGFCVCSTHVDDIFVIFDKIGKTFRDSLFENILKQIPIENLGSVSWALKTSILRDRKQGVLKISQEQYCRDFLSRTGASKFPPLKSPATNPNFPENIAADDSLDRCDETLKKEFQSDIGAFWWLAQISRPDIFYAVHRCSKLVNKPNKRLGQRIQKIKDYLSLTPSIGIVYQRHENSPTLSGYVDAAFASEDESQSRVGYFYLFRGNLVSWASENPTRVTLEIL